MISKINKLSIYKIDIIPFILINTFLILDIIINDFCIVMFNISIVYI